MKKNNKKIILSLVLVLLCLVAGITFAFYTYETGTRSNIVAGQIYMNYEETNAISLAGVFPETKAQALARTDEKGVFEFSITGRNTSDKPIYYEIDLLDGGIIAGKTATSTKISPKHVMIYLERDGEILVDGMTFEDWNTRRVWVETIPAGTTSNITHNYSLRMWIDNNIMISNTNPNADYTTSEWNDSYASLKVAVYGDFVEKTINYSKANIMTLSFDSKNPDMTIKQLNDTANKDIVLNTSAVINEGTETEQTLYATMKLQGTSSLSYEKKNYTIVFYNDEEFKNKQTIDVGTGWGYQSKYCLKANWIDSTQSRNIVSARLASQMNERYNLFPNSPNNGVIDGFFVEVYIDGEYQGLFTMNIPKDDWMFGMDSNNENHIVMCGENPNKGSSTSFRALTSLDQDGTDWSVEVGPVTEETYEKFNRVIDFIMNSTDEEFRANFSQYLNLDATLNYFAFIELASGTDNLGKNMLMVTYDGTVWYPSLYDLDTTWGNTFDGSSILYPQKSWVEYGGGDNLLLERIIELFPQELENRYKELRKTVLSNENIINEFNLFYNSATEEMWNREKTKWSNIPVPVSPVSNTTELAQIVTDLEYHANFADSFMDSLYIPKQTLSEANLIYDLPSTYYGDKYKYLDTGIKLFDEENDANNQYTIFVKYKLNPNADQNVETLISEESMWYYDSTGNSFRDGIRLVDNKQYLMNQIFVGSNMNQNGYEALARYTVGDYQYVAMTIDSSTYRVFAQIVDMPEGYGDSYCSESRNDMYDACYTEPITGRIEMRKKVNSLSDTSKIVSNLTIGSEFFMNGDNSDVPYSENSFTGEIAEVLVYDRVFTNSEIRNKMISMQ